MLRIEPATPAELRQEARYQRHEANAMARADADPCQSYRCTCGRTESARYVAWWGTYCADECGGQLVGVQVELQAVGA